jgi:hypothetical protein
MDAIIRATYPNDTLETTDDLLNLGDRLGCNMPDLLMLPQVPYDELVKVASHDHTLPTNSGVNSELPTTPASQEREANTDVGSGRISNAAARLVRDASGNEHYIGPSGSLTFFAELRDLVSSYEKNGQHAPTSSSTFALDNVAKALEPVQEEEQHSDDDVNDNDLGNYSMASPTSIVSAASNKTDGFSPHDLDEVLKALPPREIMEALITSYFDHVHVDFPLFHRATFQDEYETFVLRARNATMRAQTSGSRSAKFEEHAFQRPDLGWLACLNMVLFFGSLSDPKSSLSENTTLRRSCISTSSSLLPHLTTRCVLSNVQALLLLSLYFHNNNDRNAAWTVVGTATRIAFAIGLHQSDLDSSFRPIQREMRKRVWCTLFTFEQFLCSTLGRPSGIGDPEVEVRVPIDGLLDDGNGLGLGFAEESLKLSRILETARQISDLRPRKSPYSTQGRALNKAPGLMRHRASPVTSATTKETVLKELESWKRGLPLHLQFLSIASRSDNVSGVPGDPATTFEELRLSLSRQTPPQIRALILLCIRYHYIVMLVTRTSLLCEIASRKSSGVTSQDAHNNSSPRASPTAGGAITSSRLASTAVTSATQICSLTLLLDSFSLLNGTSGLDVYYAYSAAMVLLLRILWVRDSSDEGDAVAEESKKKVGDMVEELRKTVRQVKKSRTMKRFTVVMDKFASVIESIGKDRNSGRTAVTAPARFMNTPESGFDNMQRGSMQRHPGTISNTASRQGLLQMGISPSGTSSTSFAEPSDWSRPPSNYASNPHPVSRQQILQSARISNPNPSPPSSIQHSIYPTSSIQPGLGIIPGISAFDSQNAVFGYEDPLDALTNGYIIDWNDLDAFVEGI